VIEGLEKLYCADCTSLTELQCIPGCNIQHGGCTWLEPEIRKKGFKLQQWIRNNFKYFVFKRWISSLEGVEWIYYPKNIGGIISKRNIRRFFQSNGWKNRNE